MAEGGGQDIAVCLSALVSRCGRPREGPPTSWREAHGQPGACASNANLVDLEARFCDLPASCQASAVLGAAHTTTTPLPHTFRTCCMQLVGHSSALPLHSALFPRVQPFLAEPSAMVPTRAPSPEQQWKQSQPHTSFLKACTGPASHQSSLGAAMLFLQLLPLFAICGIPFGSTLYCAECEGRVSEPMSRHPVANTHVVPTDPYVLLFVSSYPTISVHPLMSAPPQQRIGKQR